MFMKIHLLFLLLLLLVSAPADAKRKKKRQPKPTAEQLAHQEKLNRMLTATQHVMFIDSFVVPKNDFLKHYHLNSEAGTILRTRDLLRGVKSADSYAFVNSLQDRRMMSRPVKDTVSVLYNSDYIAGQWTDPTPLAGLQPDSLFYQFNYPFLMGDGQTLYFAANGSGGIGGYDIYMTVYDEETGRYMHPVNIGMPFNSEANDYMYAIDEYDSLGWFVTDRRQPQDTVCVYVFIPTATRETYDPLTYTPEQMASFARIDSIRATWEDKRQLQTALQRLRDRRMGTSAPTAPAFHFVINDNLEYHNLRDFKLSDNRQRMRQLLDLRKKYQEVTMSLKKARQFYDRATRRELPQVHQEIQNSEQEKTTLRQQILTLEKNIRNTENQFLTNNN